MILKEDSISIISFVLREHFQTHSQINHKVWKPLL